MAKAIMVQGTTSNAGKSFLTAALCRIFVQDGFKVAPFKSQNMALNSYITDEGLEMGRAQVMQAEAAKIKPSVKMNPILLKPNTNTGSQVIVNGEVRGDMSAVEYYAMKNSLRKDVIDAYNSLSEENDIIVIEGAGSPAEINLRDNDFVNMGMAEIADAPVLICGDIDKGGVFASLYGTVKLLLPEEQDRIKGLVINKFRGDVSILKPGLVMLEELVEKPVVGVIPYMQVDLDEEDSLSERLERPEQHGEIDIAIIRLPRMSNFTDFFPFEQMKQVSVRYVKSARDLGKPDVVILPGTKSTMDDLSFLRESGIEAAIMKHADAGGAVVGICGGYQMLGKRLSDPDGVESGGEMRGMGLLNAETVFQGTKTRTQIEGRVTGAGGIFSDMCGIGFSGYEIHMGQTVSELANMNTISDGTGEKNDGLYSGNVWGSYVHGIFDRAEFTAAFVDCLLKAKGLDKSTGAVDWDEYKEKQYDILADTVRKSLDMDTIYKILNKEI